MKLPGSELNLLKDVHVGIPPASSDVLLMKGSYDYYHYLCDGVDDRGWGCGYRTLQTLCSWVLNQKYGIQQANGSHETVPTIREIQETLVEIGDQEPVFIGSRSWIGCVEAAYCLDEFYQVQCKICSALTLPEFIRAIMAHFSTYASPIMMGGFNDTAAKAILGISVPNQQILIIDPHNCDKDITKDRIQSEGWVRWIAMDGNDFRPDYNLCCPLLPALEL